jgi:hypothetical protein
LGDLNLAEVNRFLRLVGLEQVDADRVRVVPNAEEKKYLQGPPHRLIGSEARGEYRLSETPDLARAIRPFHRTAVSLCPARAAAHACQLNLLRAVREEMQTLEQGPDAGRARILATTFYWSLVKSVPLTAEEARNEAVALARTIETYRSGPAPVSREIARNAELAFNVLVENRPARDRAALEAILMRPR